MNSADGAAKGLTKRLKVLGKKRWAKALEELFRTRLVRLNVVHFNVVAASCPWSTASWLLAEAAHLGLKKDAISYSTEMAHGTRLRRWQWTYSLLAEAVTASGGDLVTWTTAISCEAPWPHALALAMSAPPPDVALLSALHGTAPSWAATLQWLRGAKECHLEANASWQNMGIPMEKHVF
eukprot:symbB.v1.2.020732.t1/scaffold1754.1/size102984/7